MPLGALDPLFVQYVCVLCACRRHNLIAQSQSGTGKTAAFALAMLSHVDPANKWTQVSINHPTAECSILIGLKVSVIFPGMNARFYGNLPILI